MDRPLIDVIRLNTRLGARKIHTNVNLQVQQNKTTVILGRSGSGKSVLLKIILRLLPAESGEVLFEGNNILDMKEEDLSIVRKKMGVVFQANALFDSMSVYENVEFFLSYYKLVPPNELRRKSDELLSWVGLHNIGDLSPGQLSGGMQKRVAIVRALITDPSVVLFDEPTTGLDPIMTDVFNEIINNLRKERAMTSLVVTHDIGSAFKIADYIYMVEQGEIIFHGTPSEIQKSSDERVQQFISGKARGPIVV